MNVTPPQDENALITVTVDPVQWVLGKWATHVEMHQNSFTCVHETLEAAWLHVARQLRAWANSLEESALQAETNSIEDWSKEENVVDNES